MRLRFFYKTEKNNSYTQNLRKFSVFLLVSFILINSCKKNNENKETKSHEENIIAEFIEKTDSNIAETNVAGEYKENAANTFENINEENQLSEALEVLEMEEKLQNMEEEVSEYDRLLEEIEKEGFYTGKENKLVYLSHGSEIFIPENTAEGTVLITSNKDEVKRIFYDNFYRKSGYEIWQIKNLEDYLLKKVERYEYEGESVFPAKKILEENNRIFEFFYNNENKLTKSKLYKTNLVQAETFKQNERIKIETGQKEEKKLEVEKNYFYDAKQRLVQENSISYKNGKKTGETKTVYKYNPDFSDEIPPDFEFYENGQLVSKNIYSNNSGDYIKFVYFDDKSYVKSFYKAYVHVKDEYFGPDKLRRVRNYE